MTHHHTIHHFHVWTVILLLLVFYSSPSSSHILKKENYKETAQQDNEITEDIEPARGQNEVISANNKQNHEEAKTKRTAVLYTYYETPLGEANLKFFLQTGVYETDEIHYYFIINGYRCNLTLPQYKNVEVIYRPNTCFDFGSWGIVLKQKQLLARYAYFILMNSSVRGPFLLQSLRGLKVHWTSLFTTHIEEGNKNQIKLFGLSINCFTNPHVQSMLLVADHIAIEIGLKEGIFKCYSAKSDAIFGGEIILSRKVLEAGYNIGSMLALYSGVDFRNKSNWGCNKHVNPWFIDDGKGSFYENPIHPFETIFVKANIDIGCGPYASLVNRYEHQILCNLKKDCVPSSEPIKKNCLL